MNQKKHIVRYICFILLLAIAGYYLFFRYSSGTIKPSWKKFAVADTSLITTIVLSDDSTSITLSRTEKGWLLNNSFSTRTDAVRALLNVAARIDTRSPLPKSVADSLTELTKSKGINVKFMEGNSTIKEYNVYTTKTLGLGTIGKLENAPFGFSLQLLGFKEDIASLFVLDSDYWKSNKLFVADINQILKVDVEIPESPEKSFSVSINEKGIHLKATYFDKEISPFDTSRVVSFIMGLTNLSYEKILGKSSIEEHAAIVLSQPDQIFTITLANKNRLVLKTYPIPVDEYRDEFGRTVKFDLNRLYISFNNDAIVAIASYIVFDPVLKDITSFRLKQLPKN